MADRVASSSVQTGKRFAQRARTDLQARLETLDSRRTVLLENISATGARIRLADPPRPGSDVVIQCGKVDVIARVIWASKDACGVHFDQEAADEDVLELKAESDRVAQSGYTHAELLAFEDWRAGHAD